MPVHFADLATADLVVDEIYEGGKKGNASDDPLDRLLQCGLQGGIRLVGSRSKGYSRIVLYSSLRDVDWPDTVEDESGLVTFYGDNKRAGQDLHKPRGNKALHGIFEALHADPPRRTEIPPCFVFTRGPQGRDVVFKGLAVPGSPDIGGTGDLVAIWRSRSGSRFQNYRAIFSILDTGVVPRTWLTELEAGIPHGSSCPKAFKTWVKTGRYSVLRAPRTVSYRKKAAQLPATVTGRQVLARIYGEFKSDPYAFESCATELWQLQAAPLPVSWMITQRSRDGGRDAIGLMNVGPPADPVRIDFALEAKCYQPDGPGHGVRDTARLISRLRHRQFGVFVTTAHLQDQAYRELRDDGHPVVVLCGRDIVELLAQHGVTTVSDVEMWLESIRSRPHPTI